MKKTLIAILISTGFVSAANAAGFTSSDLGTTAAQFLEIPVGAKASAMGGAAVAEPAQALDAATLYYNPAGLSQLEGVKLTFMTAPYFGDLNYKYGAVTKNLNNTSAVGISVQYMSPDTINKIDKTGAVTGDSFTPSDMALTAGYGFRFNELLELGVSGKYIRSQITDKAATAFALDGGLRATLSDKLTLGAAISNFGSGIKYRSKTEDLPLTIRVGASYVLKSFTLETDMIAPKSAGQYCAFGAQYALKLSEKVAASVRTGYNTRNVSSKLGARAGVSYGFGLSWSSFTVDYASTSFGDLGVANRLSFSLAFIP